MGLDLVRWYLSQQKIKYRGAASFFREWTPGFVAEKAVVRKMKCPIYPAARKRREILLKSLDIRRLVRNFASLLGRNCALLRLTLWGSVCNVVLK